VIKQNKGFSLVELMVVVAIIAILASFAVPQYSNFQAKARQKEAYALMNAFYSAAKASEGEYGWFPGNLEATGFNPAGQLHYRILVVDGTNPPSGPNNDTCINTSDASGKCSANFIGWTNVEGGSFGGATAVNCTAATSSTLGTFNACFSALIRNNAGTDADTWLVNQAKLLESRNDGIL
jgi:prepilin-type N-terminal cleavage/methylation domain-containing protein